MRTEIKGLHTRIDDVKKHAKKEVEKLKGKASTEKVQSLVYEVIALGSKRQEVPQVSEKNFEGSLYDHQKQQHTQFHRGC